MTPATSFLRSARTLLLAATCLVWMATAVQAQEQAAEPVATTEAHEEPHGDWMSTIARVFNFTLLVGGLVYFLKAPVTAHLAARDATIRRELVDAKTLRTSAEQQLAAVRARLSELPGELAALEARGREELALERTRLQAATTQERQKLVERTRREIEMQFRVARRDLVEHTADLAVQIARGRIEREITPADHARLIDRYAEGVRS